LDQHRWRATLSMTALGGSLLQTESDWPVSACEAIARDFSAQLSTIPRCISPREHAARAVRLVIAEAMACGRAVVASRGGGASEIFTAGEDALVYKAGSVHALAERMRELSRDPARRAAARRFTRERLADELMPIYRMLSAQAAA
jgi:glycosyltransferase involved in cell wall biosynthesis